MLKPDIKGQNETKSTAQARKLNGATNKTRVKPKLLPAHVLMPRLTKTRVTRSRHRNPTSQELHRRVRCLAMDGDLSTVILSSSFDKRYRFVLAFQYRRFKVNQHPVSEVIPVLLKSGQSASREEAVEKRNICRSMQNS
ncbi:hypothetical protein F2Q69_00006216 [Brassica cretica]|uniref:Uncharacterized protein n=1 Tax=Brassica cretica TaxID=69181 RepID=A0A8S9PBR1_BRACR|nr:hypothetical protein F2Q69_00006216 [Brassica cretica]